MDIATHLLVPYAGLLAAFGYWRRGREADRPRAAKAAVFGIAGFAPDLDGIVDPLSARWDSLYWLQHRGVSHTLVGAPVFALLLLLVLNLLAARFPKRFGLFAFQPSLLAYAVVGSWTHLVLDMVTLSGVPLWWPFAFGRVHLMHFHWLVIWLLPIGAIGLALHAFGRLSRHRIVQLGAVVTVLLLVIAGVRAWSRPDVEADAVVIPRSSSLEWLVLQPLPNGSWSATLHRLGDEYGGMVFGHQEPPEAAEAIAAARDTDAYRGFLMGSYGPRVTHAEPADGGSGGAWRVTFTDVAQRYEAVHEPRWTPTEPHDAWGYVSFLVRGHDVEVLHRGW